MRRINSWLRQDLWTKVVAVILAIFLWINVAGPPRPSPLAPVQDTFQNVGVEWRGLPDGLSVAAMDPPTVAVTVRAPASIADGLGSGSFAAFVDLRDSVAGRLAFNVDVAVPPQVQLVSVTPARVTVSLAPVSTRAVAVQVEPRGTLADGYRALRASVDPLQVAVRGGASAARRVAAVVARVDVDGRTGDVAADVPLVAVDAGGDPVMDVSVEPATAHVTVPIVAWGSESVPVEPVLAGQPAAGYRIGPMTSDPASVRIEGPRAILAGIQRVFTDPLDVSGASGDVKGKVRIHVPTGVTATPLDVNVTVRVMKSP